MIAESCQSSSIGTSRIARWIWPVLVLNGLVCLARVPTSAVLKRHRQVEALRELAKALGVATKTRVKKKRRSMKEVFVKKKKMITSIKKKLRVG